MSEETGNGAAKKFLYVNRKAPYGTIYALESLEVVLIAAAFEQDVDAAILGEASFRDIKLGHDLDTADDSGMHRMRRAKFFIEAAIDAVADAGFFLIRLDVDIGGAIADGVVDEVVDELDDGGMAGDFLEVADFLDLGFDEVIVHNVNREQEAFIQAYGKQVIPGLRWAKGN